MSKNKKKPGYLLLLLVILAGFVLQSWKINQQPIEEWDEARRGINALGMLSRGDYLNYYFLDEMDTFNSKPPLTVWLIALNFKIFGVTNFALRFHSILAIYLFLLFFARIVLLYRDEYYAALVIGILISVQGIIGFHVGRTGDTDSLLLLFLTAFIYFFLKYWDFSKKWALYIAAIFFGLAFYTKSVAAFIPVPGVLAYILITRGTKKLFNKELIISVLIAFSIILSWAFLSAKGVDDNRTHLTLWERIFSVDLYRRFTDREFEAGYDPFYIFHVLDMNFNIWNYILYLGGIIGLYRIIKRKTRESLRKNRLILFSLSIICSYVVILTVSMNKHQWYLAPALPFFAVLIVEFIYFLKEKTWMVVPASFVLSVILIAFRFYEFNNPDRSVPEFFEQHHEVIEKAEVIYIDSKVSQDIVFECIKWNYKSATLTNEIQDLQYTQLYLGPSYSSQSGIIKEEIQGYYFCYNPCISIDDNTMHHSAQ
ncbi:MAG: ArnT family glycosyltransferase [Bacteroidales bacterium]